MRYLYIDTSSSYLYSGIVEDNKLIAEIKEEFGQSLSEVALPKIVSLFEKNNLTAKDIDKIIVVNGPGSFTGIRIGVTIAKVYAYSLKKKITTISSLQAMALSTKKNVEYRIPIIDARRGYVYAAIYDKDNMPILKEQYLSLQALLCAIENLPGDYTVITNDETEIGNKEEYSPNYNRIISTYQDKEELNPHAVNPIYLKLTEAEEKQGVSSDD